MIFTYIEKYEFPQRENPKGLGEQERKNRQGCCPFCGPSLCSVGGEGSVDRWKEPRLRSPGEGIPRAWGNRRKEPEVEGRASWRASGRARDEGEKEGGRKKPLLEF